MGNTTDNKKYAELKEKMDDLLSKFNSLQMEFMETYKAVCELGSEDSVVIEEVSLDDIPDFLDEDDDTDDFGAQFVEEVVIEVKDDFDVEDTHEIDFQKLSEELDRLLDED